MDIVQKYLENDFTGIFTIPLSAVISTVNNAEDFQIESTYIRSYSIQNIKNWWNAMWRLLSGARHPQKGLTTL
jgi:hypothetical protein